MIKSLENMQTLGQFCNPLYIALIRGPKAGKSFVAGSAYQPHTETMAQIHGIQNITLGAIAMVSILVSSLLPHSGMCD